MMPRPGRPRGSSHVRASRVWVRVALAATACLAGLVHVGAQTQTFVAPKAEVKNVTFNRTGTTFTVTYDLEALDPAAANAVFEVILEVTLDDGSLFRPVSVSGDMGSDTKVTPGTGKKIVWESSRDIDNQGYDKFQFAVEIVSAVLMESDSPTTDPVDSEPSSTPTNAPAGLPGTWIGTYVGFPAQLDIVRQDATSFSGVLYVVTEAGELGTALQVDGALIEDGQAIEFRETRVRERGAEGNWKLGSASGRFASDGSAMAGSGTDGDASYAWMFAQATPAFEAGSVWSGEYAGEPARLSIEQREGGNWSGRLSVTTRNGRPPTQLRVEGSVSAEAVEIRELQVVSLGAAGSWNLGTGVGTFESGGLQLLGAGTDVEDKSYRFSLVRGDR